MNGFVAECWVIILILGIAGYMFVRSKRKSWAPCVLPLMLVPFINIIYSPIGRHIARLHEARASLIRLILYIISFLAASAWVVLISRRLPKGKSRFAYVFSSVAFMAILILIFLVKLPHL